MEAAELKIELIDKIEHADFKQLREISGLLINYFNSQYDPTEGWDALPESHKEAINEGLEQLDAGLGVPFKEVNERLKKKYGLNS
ncbi:hypothetical protein [uncultured Mucilaginibacter sp.]|uniref:hypothetical protein n=1 Tax=uncultured Mucilaginibacter sp. TaxID=797541 RepID=UPI0025DDE1D1|nr:hypothetical protein [uncultured Mucilaginibacter sp.]